MRIALLGILIGWLFVAACAHLPPAAEGLRPARQTLIIALDGVPYVEMKKLKDEGYFAGFQPPSKVISTFPSTTTSALGAMFRPVGADQPAGYDREYYSREKKKVVSVLSTLFHDSPTEFKNFFDYYRKSPFQKFWIYAAPGLSGRRDLERIRTLVRERPARRYYLTYIGGTDGAGHVLGEKRIRRWLIFMDGFLQKMRKDYARRYGGELEIVLFSDHGFYYIRKPNAVSKNTLTQKLRRLGLTFSNNLKHPGHVVSIQWGNISGANFYAEPAYVPEIAGIMARLDGVDLVSYPLDRQIRIISYRDGHGESAEISCDTGRSRCRYHPISGDPLHYAGVLDKLRRAGRLDRNGFASSKDWFEETKDIEYPDALYRLHDAFFTLVQNPASILMSTKRDYEYGNVITRVGAWLHGGLKGTHGGLFQESSDAVLMTTDAERRFPAALRYDQVMSEILDGDMKALRRD